VSERLPRRTATFIVRIWAEYLGQSPPAWRGEIEHVESREKAYLHEASDIVEFITALAPGEVRSEDMEGSNRKRERNVR
jgi:hypothetical protein